MFLGRALTCNTREVELKTTKRKMEIGKREKK